MECYEGEEAEVEGEGQGVFCEGLPSSATLSFSGGRDKPHFGIRF